MIIVHIGNRLVLLPLTVSGGCIERSTVFPACFIGISCLKTTLMGVPLTRVSTPNTLNVLGKATNVHARGAASDSIDWDTS